MAELRGAPVRASSPQGRFTEGAVAVDGSELLDPPGVAALVSCLAVAPGRPARSTGRPELMALWAVLRRMMSQAVEDGRIVTVEGPDRLAMPENEARKVYKQQTCRDCGAPVTTSAVGGRTAYHCPVEQPE
jgi:endonuclease-8